MEESSKLLEKMDSFEGENMDVVVHPQLDPTENKLVLLTHDESCFE